MSEKISPAGAPAYSSAERVRLPQGPSGDATGLAGDGFDSRRGGSRALLALTLHQPWAWAVARAGKPVENRTWPPPRGVIGSHIAIHAGKTLDREAIEDLAFDGYTVPERLDRGAIVAVARVIGWVRCTTDLHVTYRASLPRELRNRTPEAFSGVTRDRAQLVVQSPWWAGPIGWVLEDVTAIEAVGCLGRQGLWTVPPDVADEVRRRWREARRAA